MTNPSRARRLRSRGRGHAILRRPNGGRLAAAGLSRRIHGLGAIDTGGKKATAGAAKSGRYRRTVGKLRLGGGRSTGGCDKGNITELTRF